MSAITKVLNIPSLTNEILLSLGECTIAQTSRSFRDAHRRSLVATVLEIGRIPSDIALRAQELTREGETLEQALLRRVHEISFPPILGNLYANAAQNALEEQNPGMREARLSNLLVQASQEPPAYLREVSELDRWDRDCYALLAELPAKINLAARLRIVSQREGLDPHRPEEVSSCLRATHKDQEHESRLLGRRAVQLFENSQHGHFGDIMNPVSSTKAPISLLKAGEIAFLHPNVFSVRDAAVCALWKAMKEQNPALGLAVNAPAADIRAWMNDPANQDALGAIPQIYYDNFVGMPSIAPEIGKLTGLRSLNIHAGEVHDIPEEMRQLQHLQKLVIRLDENCHNIPPLIGELPALEKLWIYGPVHTLPDDIWRRFASLLPRVEDVLMPSECDMRLGRRLGLTPETLTDIPFRLWFSEKCEISYVHLLHLSGLTALLDSFNTQDSWQLALRLAIAFFLGIPVGLLHLLLNGSILLANLFMMYALEPVVTFARDLLGYSRMVHVRDLHPNEVL